MQDLGGVYRGIVADVADPEQRKRYRVRVGHVHDDQIPVEALPWAEWCVFGGKGFGDFPHLEVGDPVFVMFEGANRRFPVIIGGWLSYQGGTNDLPNELAGDYARTQQRWVRVDRAGNRITMSPLPDEQYVELQSGSARVTVRGLSGSVEVESDSHVVVTAPTVRVVASKDVSVEAERLVAQVSDVATVRCDGTLNLQGASTINLGRYQPPVVGLAVLPKTTAQIDVEADEMLKAASLRAIDVDAGTTLDVDAVGDITVHGRANVTVIGDGSVNVRSDQTVAVQAKNITVDSTEGVTMTVGGDCVLTAQGRIEIEAQDAIEIDAASATLAINGNVEIAATGNATVRCEGVARVQAAGVAQVVSDVKIELDAPVIEVRATTLLSLMSDGVARLDGSQVLVG